MTFKILKPKQTIADALQTAINHKTKPLGSLGMLEPLAMQIGLIQQTLKPAISQPTMLIFAGDHGIAHENVSPYPQAVTAQMVLNFLQGGAAINVFASQNNMRLQVVDSGVNHQFEAHDMLIDAKIRMGSRNFLLEPAMTLAECNAAIAKGAQILKAQVAQGCNVLGFGEMGIANTSSASCLMAIICGLPISACVGRGTGLDDAGLTHKEAVLRKALLKHGFDAPVQLNQQTIKQVLATFGGFEIAMMVGAMFQAAESRCVLIIDGFITTAALLVAAQLQPNILHYCVFSHCSDESGHQKMLAYLQAKPLLNIGLRLGEGTGGALAYPLVLAAVNFLNNMASFESAGVSQEKEANNA